MPVSDRKRGGLSSGPDPFGSKRNHERVLSREGSCRPALDRHAVQLQGHARCRFQIGNAAVFPPVPTHLEAREIMSAFYREKVLAVQHWTDTLFSFRATRDAGFRSETRRSFLRSRPIWKQEKS